jgi:spore coat polysaccharide biosynthesis predicted glycosyltransferase SpsG
MQFDNAACFPIRARWIVNINPSAERDMYRSISSETCRLLLGPAYAVLRPEFMATRELYTLAPTASRALVFLGGGDVRDPLKDLLGYLLPSFPGTRFHVVGSNASLTELSQVQDFANFVCVGELPTLAQLLPSVDLAIVSAGTSSYECACVGVPFVTVEVADNQTPIAQAWMALGVAPRLGRWDEIARDTIAGVLESVLSGPARRRQSELGRSLVDGRGVERVVNAILESA